MILRRLIGHLRDQQWTAVGLDFLVTVVGVFVGIQAANLNATRIDRTLEAQYVQRIRADLGVIIDTATRQREFERGKMKQIEAALAMTRVQLSQNDQIVLGTFLTTITLRLSPNFESATFVDLQNSGRLSLIEDAALRQGLSSYFGRLQYLKTAIGRNNDNYVETFVTFLRSEGISAGYADPGIMPNVPTSSLDIQFSELSRERFGPRMAGDDSMRLVLPMTDPFWGRLRAQLTWRRVGAVANEWALTRIIADAEKMKSDVEKLRSHRLTELGGVAAPPQQVASPRMAQGSDRSVSTIL